MKKGEKRKKTKRKGSEEEETNGDIQIARARVSPTSLPFSGGPGSARRYRYSRASTTKPTKRKRNDDHSSSFRAFRRAVAHRSDPSRPRSDPALQGYTILPRTRKIHTRERVGEVRMTIEIAFFVVSEPSSYSSISDAVDLASYTRMKNYHCERNEKSNGIFNTRSHERTWNTFLCGLPR